MAVVAVMNLTAAACVESAGTAAETGQTEAATASWGHWQCVMRIHPGAACSGYEFVGAGPTETPWEAGHTGDTSCPDPHGPARRRKEGAALPPPLNLASLRIFGERSVVPQEVLRTAGSVGNWPVLLIGPRRIELCIPNRQTASSSDPLNAPSPQHTGKGPVEEDVDPSSTA